MAATPAPNAPFAGKDLFSLEAAADPQISADGRWIAYVHETNDIKTDRARSTIRLIDTSTGKESPLASEKDSYSSPRWSPDGARLAYLLNTDGATQIYVRSMATGQTTKVAAPANGIEDITWSPDGRQIAYIARTLGKALTLGQAPEKPEGAQWADPIMVTDKVNYFAHSERGYESSITRLFVAPAEGGPARQLTSDERSAAGTLSWSPDGQAILFALVPTGDLGIGTAPHTVDSDVYEVDLRSGSLSARTRHEGPHFAAQFSPDGKYILYLGHNRSRRIYENVELYMMNRDGSGARSLTSSLDRSVDKAQWVGNDSVYVSYNDHGVERVDRVELDGQRTNVVANSGIGGGFGLPYAEAANFSVSPKGALAYTSGDTQNPGDVYVADGHGVAKQMTHLNSVLREKTLAQVRSFSVNAPDGQQIDAWLATPPGYTAGEKVPLILEVHGGPFACYGPYFSSDVQLYAAAGYAVLYTNPAGSTCDGAAFSNLLSTGDPDGQYGELMAAVDTVIAQKIADPDKLFVTGASWGGVMTSWIVGKTQRFKAAAALSLFVNWTSWPLSTDLPMTYWHAWFEKKVWEDPMGYWKRSPLSLAGNYSTPTLVMTGSVDDLVPVTEAREFYSALKMQNVPTELVIVRGAAHNLSARPSQAAAKVSAVIAWFDRYRSQ